MNKGISSLGKKIAEKVKTKYLWYESEKKWKLFDADIKNIQTYCFFIGYPRSGHSLVGSLLDSHPEICLSNELDAFKYFEKGFSKKQVFYLIITNSENIAKKGRSQTGYKYEVKGQYQGRFTNLRVIGDKKGGMTTQRITRRSEIINSLQDEKDIRLKFIHVVRNPFDNITTMTLRTNSTVEKEIFHYFKLCTSNLIIKDLVNPDNVYDLRHEGLINYPVATLKKLIAFLEIDGSDGYLHDCANILYKKPHRSRNKINWTTQNIRLVENQIKQFPFLDGYAFNTD